MGAHRRAGIAAKLSRADEQTEFLQAEWGRFLKDNQPYGVNWKHDPDATKYRLYKPCFKIREDPPPRISVILGEIVHDLRSALDHLACELIEAHGRRPIRRAAWPVALDESTWVNTVEFPRDRTGKRIRGPLHGLPRTSDAWAYIKQTQPYQRGRGARTPLAELNRLWSIDKHSAIHMSYVYPGLDVFEMFVWDAGAHFVSGRALLEPGQPLKDGAELALFTFARTGPDPKMRVKRGVPFDLAIGTERPDKPTSQATKGIPLVAIREEVGRIVADCRVWTG